MANALIAENACMYQIALPKGKMLDVYEGKIQEKIGIAITRSLGLINSGAGDFVAVICHYPLHELLDKDKSSFDILHFFATIFQDGSVATWFTYTSARSFPMLMIPESCIFDQRTMTLMLSHDPLVQHYRTFFDQLD